MIIGLMFLKNQVVYIQFHPVAYIVKLNIEMSMAALITKIAIGGENTDFEPAMSSHIRTVQPPHSRSKHASHRPAGHEFHSFTSARGQRQGSFSNHEDVKGIRTQKEVIVEARSLSDAYHSGVDSERCASPRGSDDDVLLKGDMQPIVPPKDARWSKHQGSVEEV